MRDLSIKANEVCRFLKELGIEFEYVTHSPAFTIEECLEIEKKIDGRICKNLFLRTTTGNSRKFVTKDISKKLGSSRLSFAGGEEMNDILNTEPGSLSITSLIFDKNKAVALAIDKDVAAEEYICCHPSDNTATLKIRTKDIEEKLLPYLKITPIYIEV